MISISASSTGLTSVYSGAPLARTMPKSGTFSGVKVSSPRTRSVKVIGSSGIRKRTIEARRSPSYASICTAVSSRQWPS